MKKFILILSVFLSLSAHAEFKTGMTQPQVCSEVKNLLDIGVHPKTIYIGASLKKLDASLCLIESGVDVSKFLDATSSVTVSSTNIFGPYRATSMTGGGRVALSPN